MTISCLVSVRSAWTKENPSFGLEFKLNRGGGRSEGCHTICRCAHVLILYFTADIKWRWVQIQRNLHNLSESFENLGFC